MTQLSNNNNSAQSNKKPSRFRSVFAQALATTIKNLLVLDLGLCFSLSTIVIPALTGIQNEHNRNEFLSITPVQASWLGALGNLIQPLGSLLSTMITDPLGRKRSMILVNIPFAIGWFMLSQSTAVWHVFLGTALQGLAIGLMEAPILTYLGEICEPSTRGVLIGYTFICHTLGMFIIMVLNTFMPWRTVSLVCLGLPVFAAISICFIPETPQWLLSKGRTVDAEKSLCWLRGWASSDDVTQEFHDLQRHSERAKSCNTCIKQNLKCTHLSLPTMRDKFTELKRKQTLKPFVIVMSLFFLVHMTGVLPMRPYIVQIFRAYESPIAPDKAAMVMSFLDNLANITFMCLVRFTGKRKLYLTMLSGVFICTLIVSGYGFAYLPSGYISFNQQNQTSFPLENKNLSYIPFIALCLWSFFAYCGFNGMPWVFLSELFPFKSRGIASGLAAALTYVLGSLAKKTYYNLETSLGMPGVTLLYCIIAAIGLIWTYNILPETENRSLEDIERHFSDNSKKLTDRHIPISKNAGSLENSAKANESVRSENKSAFENGGFDSAKV